MNLENAVQPQMDTDGHGYQALAGGEWRMRRVERGAWRVESGERRVESGGRRAGNTSPLAPLPIRCGEGNHWRSLAGSARSRPKQSRLRAWLEHRNPTLLPPPPRQLWQNFEDEAEADDEEDSVPVNFQTGFHVRLPRNHFTKKGAASVAGGRLSFLILFHACTVACTAMLTGWLQTPTRASFKRKMAR